jgi:hypothetical protein
VRTYKRDGPHNSQRHTENVRQEGLPLHQLEAATQDVEQPAEEAVAGTQEDAKQDLRKEQTFAVQRLYPESRCGKQALVESEAVDPKGRAF